VDHPDEPSNPHHDRVRLSPSERARLAELERALDDGPAGGDRPLAVRRVLGRLAARVVRRSAWLTLAGVALLPFRRAGGHPGG
jgi:hypothetical protein